MANGNSINESEWLDKGRYKVDGQWYTSSGHKIKDAYDPDGGSIAQFGGDAQRQKQYEDEQRQKREANLAWNLGTNWQDIYDIDTGSYKEGYSSRDAAPDSRFGQYYATGEDKGSRPEGWGMSGGSGSLGGSGSYYENIIATYEKAQREQQEAQQAALDAVLAGYDRQKTQIEQAADDASRQAYVSKMLNQRDLTQQLSTAGYSGGMTESANLQLQSDYENNRNDILTGRDASLAEIDLAKQNAEATGMYEMADAAAAYDQKIADLYAQMELDKQNAINAANQAALAAQLEQETAAANYKPHLGIDEAKELWEEGVRTEQLVKDLKYHGYLPESYDLETAAAAAAAVYKSPLPVTEISEEDFAAQLREYGIVPGTAGYDLWMKDYAARRALAERNAAEANGALTAGTQKTVPATTQGVANIYSGLTEKQARVLNRALQLEIPLNGLRLIDESDLTEEEQEAVVAAYVSRMGPYMEGREASLAVGAQ